MYSFCPLYSFTYFSLLVHPRVLLILPSQQSLTSGIIKIYSNSLPYSIPDILWVSPHPRPRGSRGSNRSIHLLFDGNFDYAQQSRTGNENVWKWNYKFRLDRTNRLKKTNAGVGPLRPENFYADQSVSFVSRPNFPTILT